MADITLLEVPVFSTLCNAAFALRREVFVLEQKVPADEEFDAADLAARHLVAIAEGNVVGTLRIIAEPEHIKIGRVVVRHDWRGHGIARLMMERAMALGRIDGQKRFYLTAQADKLGFYERLGFVAFGEEFDDGGMPHRAMKTY
jgi:predicted GNAT family N-acyltransferase